MKYSIGIARNHGYRIYIYRDNRIGNINSRFSIKYYEEIPSYLLIVLLASPSIVSFSRADDLSSFVDRTHDRSVEAGIKQAAANEVIANEVIAEATVLTTESPEEQQKEPESISINEASFLTFK